MNYELEKFRNGDDELGVSGIVYSSMYKRWIGSDSLGQLYTYDLKSKEKKWEASNLIETSVTSVDINVFNDECVIASEGSVSLYPFPNVSDGPDTTNIGKQL